MLVIESMAQFINLFCPNKIGLSCNLIFSFNNSISVVNDIDFKNNYQISVFNPPLFFNNLMKI